MTMPSYLNEEGVMALRSLANRWMMLARDYDRDSKNPKLDAEKAANMRGLSEAFRRASLDLANALRSAGTTAVSDLPTAPPPQEEAPAAAASNSPLASQYVFREIDQSEAIRFLEFAGATPRDVFVRKDNTILAVFSKMQPLADSERLNLIRSADKRVVILSSGKTRESKDPYVEFGFRA
jgi:hypothetical protein